MNMVPQLFRYEGKPLRMFDRQGEPWFVAKDVCQVLDIQSHRGSISLLDEDEKGVYTVDSPSGQQEMTIINEPGLYSLILRSRKPEAKRFKRWVTHEVLPSIRRTGAYQVAAPQPEASGLPERLARLEAEVAAMQAALAKPQTPAYPRLLPAGRRLSVPVQPHVLAAAQDYARRHGAHALATRIGIRTASIYRTLTGQHASMHVENYRRLVATLEPPQPSGAARGLPPGPRGRPVEITGPALAQVVISAYNRTGHGPTVYEAAQALGCSKRTVYRRLTSLPFYAVTGGRILQASELRQALPGPQPLLLAEA